MLGIGGTLYHEESWPTEFRRNNGYGVLCRVRRGAQLSMLTSLGWWRLPARKFALSAAGMCTTADWIKVYHR